MNNLSEIVKSCEGVWPSEDIPNGYLLEFMAPGTHTISSMPDESFICSRADFDTEARRQGYIEGFEGEWDGKGYPPPHTKCEFKAVTRDGVFSHNNFADDYEPCTIKYASENGCHIIDQDGAECFMDSLDYRITFRPLKSDRDRWVEDADKLVSTVEAGPYVMLETVYEALKSGKLPMPEKD